MSYIYIEHPFLMFLDHTRWRSTVGRTPLDEWSARRRDLYLTTHDTQNRQISMPPVGFESTISAGGRPQVSYQSALYRLSVNKHKGKCIPRCKAAGISDMTSHLKYGKIRQRSTLYLMLLMKDRKFQTLFLRKEKASLQPDQMSRPSNERRRSQIAG